jgi:FkbM family methyltransferase
MLSAERMKNSILKNLRWRFSPPRVQCAHELSHMGTTYGGYYIDPRGLSSQSVIYSLGVGEDISFDLSLIQRFGVTVHAFDPTPRVKDWLSSQSVPAQFQFHDVGIADYDGEAQFYLPPKSEYISHSIVHAEQYSSEWISVPMIRLGTAMRRLGQNRIDILKMDVEGAEYSILKDMVHANIRVGQLLVEFHHRLSTVGTARTREAIELLTRWGMKTSYVCSRAEVFTFTDRLQP